MKYSSLQLLDNILYYLKERSENEPSDLEYEISELYFEISNRDTKALIEKLAKDGYIDNIIPNFGKFLPDRKYQFITFDGLVFLEEGGYVKKRRIAKQLSNTFLFLQVIIAFGTLIAAIYYIQELFK